MTLKLVTPGGDPAAGIDPQEFRDLRNRFEKRLDELLMQFGETIRDSPMAKPDVNAILANYNQRWNSECDLAAKKDLQLDREAFNMKVNDMLAKISRQRMYQGPITEEALQLLGFRKWSDGTWRTMQVVLTPVGKDWSVHITEDMVGPYGLPFLLQLTSAAGIKHLVPFNEPAPAPTPFWKRLFGGKR